MLTTRRTLRRRVGERVGDMILVVATDASDPSLAIDAVRLWHDTKALEGRLAFVSGAAGANAGAVTRVAGNDRTGRSVTFDPPLPESISAGDEIELWNERAVGLAPSQVHGWIDEAIAAVAETALIEAVLEPVDPFALDPPVVALPAEWWGVFGVEHRRNGGSWCRLHGDAWRVDIPTRTVELDHWGGNAADALRVRGFAVPGPLGGDDETTWVDAEYVVCQVGAWAGMATAHRRPPSEADALRGMAQLWQQQADERRGKARTRLRAGTVRL